MFSEKVTGIPAFRNRGALVPSREIFAAFADRAYLESRLAATVGSPKLDGEPILLTGDVLGRWYLRDQRDTNTCVAFATAACLELLQSDGDASRLESLSPQFIYWLMRKKYPLTEDRPPDYEDGATRISQARKVIAEDGVCAEQYYPFALTIDDVGPRAEAREDASTRIHPYSDYGIFKTKEEIDAQRTAQNFLDFLRAGRPIIAGVPVYRTTAGHDNFHSVDAYRTGVVLGPTDGSATGIIAGQIESSGHVVCIIGFWPDPDEPKGGWFVFRNSWGRNFAREPDAARGVPAPGYGVLSASYVDRFCWEYCCPKAV